MSDKSYISSW